MDTEIALLIVKNKEENNASKIYSPVGKFPERAKQTPQSVNQSPLCSVQFITSMQKKKNKTAMYEMG